MDQYNDLELVNLLRFVVIAHSRYPKKPSKAFRKWDGKTPYAVHPIWCAMTIMSEESLSEEIRVLGSKVLLLHDIIEDTNVELPSDLDPEVKRLVLEMTFPGGTAQEMEEIWERSDLCKLFKLFDKVSNLLDVGWMDVEKFKDYRQYTRKLAREVERKFGFLNVMRMI